MEDKAAQKKAKQDEKDAAALVELNKIREENGRPAIA